MALPASPPISMTQICAEFGMPPTTPLASFLRGAGIVPNIPQNAAVPTALPISMLQMLGATGYIALSAVSVPPGANGQVFDPEPAPAQTTVTASVQINPSNGSGSYTYSWSGVSGTTLTLSPSNGGKNMTFSSLVNKNNTVNAVYRCTVSDGVNSVAVDVAVSLYYFNDV